MLQLETLTIDRYRMVEAGTVLHFGSGFNVLLGKNGVGKTTLLNLITNIVNDETVVPDQAMSMSYRLRLGSCLLSVQYAFAPREPSSVLTDSVRSEISASQNLSREWSLTVSDDAPTPLYTCRIKGNVGTCTLRGSGQERSFVPDGTYSIFIGMVDGLMVNRDSDAQGPLRELIMRFLRATHHRRAPRYDEALDCFARLSDAAVEFEHAHATKREYFPAALAQAALSQLKVESTSVTVNFDEEVQLARVLPLLDFDNGQASIQLATRFDKEDGAEYRFHGVNLILKSSNGAIGGEALSFGQKRLLALFWYLSVRQESPVVADELANGFHHEWIVKCVNELASRQCFLTSQNPLLLDYVPVRPDTTLIQCSLASAGKAGRRRVMKWRNFTPVEMQQLARACEVGIQQVSEILRDQALW